MAEVTFKIDQLKINLTQPVNPQLLMVSYVRRILYTSGIDFTDWENISCVITYNTIEQDNTKTFNEARIPDGGILVIQLSMLITIEIVNKQFPCQGINVDAFDRTQKFKEYIIQNYLRNTNYDIGIINVQDGKQIEKDTWIQNGIGNSIPVLLNISIKQSIKWKGEVIDINFNIYSPISKVIQNFMYKLNFNGIISFQCQNSHLKPELSYFNHNLPIDAAWQASIPNEVVYRVLYQKQSREKQIICYKDQQINQIIQQLRKEFNIKSSNKITLMYHWALDRYATVAQEAIPNYSLLKLVEEDQKGQFLIQLQKITESPQEPQITSTHYVNNDTSLEDLSNKIERSQNEEVNFFLETPESSLKPKLTLESQNVYDGCTILYKIVQKAKTKPRIVAIQGQIPQKKFGVLVVGLNIVINVEISIQNDIKALAEVMRYKLSMHKNQIVLFSIGTRLLQENQMLNEIMGGNFEFLQAQLSTNIQINFQNVRTNQVTVITVDLEDTLRKVSEKLKIDAQFTYKGAQLGLDETFAQLQVFNNDVILFDQVSTPKEDSAILKSDNQKPNNILHQPSSCKISSVDNENVRQKIPEQIPYQAQPDTFNNNNNNDQISVNASVGEKLYRCKMNGNTSCEQLKKFIYDLAIQGDPQNIKQYNLLQGDQVLRDDQTISSLNKKEVEVQFKLK